MQGYSTAFASSSSLDGKIICPSVWAGAFSEGGNSSVESRGCGSLRDEGAILLLSGFGVLLQV